MLTDAVNSNLDVIHGRRPAPPGAVDPVDSVGPVSRPVRLWRRHAAQLGALAVVLVAASAGVTRWQTSARPVSLAAAAVPASAQAVAPIAPDPPDAAVLKQQVAPAVLGLSVRRVIIDAGHGGDNLGTSTADGVNEKDLTLDIARRVRELIVGQGYEAVMTRDADEPISLLERAATANGGRGDIFVSIHLNSLRPAGARGIETYYLGPSKGPEVDAIAATENHDSGFSLSDIRSLLEKIYTNARRQESRRLAESVQRALVLHLGHAEPEIMDRGVKTAPFVVLIATEMPAIVAEVSCLSNHDDARHLNSGAYRQTIAEALAAGIQTFAHGSPAGPTERRGISGN
jgi:N-acetylmuramoyl-L-alanine amidase